MNLQKYQFQLGNILCEFAAQENRESWQVNHPVHETDWTTRVNMAFRVNIFNGRFKNALWLAPSDLKWKVVYFANSPFLISSTKAQF